MSNKIISITQSYRRRVQDIYNNALSIPMAKAAMEYAGCTTTVKFTSFLKEAIVASAFGVSGEMDAYLIALMLIGFPLGILLIPIQTAFIPLYLNIRDKQGHFAGIAFFKTVVSGTVIAMIAMILLWLFLSPWIVDVVVSDNNVTTSQSVHKLFIMLLPYYFFTGINLLGYGALQADKKFRASSLIPICTPVASIMFVYFISSERGVFALLLGFVVGSFLEYLIINFYLYRKGTALIPGRIIFSPEIYTLCKGSLVLFGGSLIMSFSPMIEQTLASKFGVGKVAALGYAFKLPAMMNGILVTAVGVTVLPFFSEMLVKQNIEECRKSFRHYVLILLSCGVVLAIFLVLFSEPLVKLLFQRGAFTASDTILVASIQKAYLWQIPGALIGMLAIRLLVAQKQFGTVTVVSAISVMILGIFASIFASKFGVVGIAMGVSISATFSGVFFVVVALRSLSEKKRANVNLP